MEHINTVVIGAGQAGLSMSYHLGRLGREHLVLERGRVAERWRSERWDSLMFQFPNWMVKLPGCAYAGDAPDAFMDRFAVVDFIDAYARQISAPVRCGIRVTSLRPSGSGRLLVETDYFALDAANVIVATGPYQLPKVPAFSYAVPPAVRQATASSYTSPHELPQGNVLVVGSGGSGCQIVEDLLASGRRVFFSVGRHRRVPRRYRGQDFGWWQERTGAADAIVDGLTPVPQAPLLTGVNGGHDIDLRDLSARGVTLLGSLGDIRDGRLRLVDDLQDNLARGDRTYDDFTSSVDEYIRMHGLAVPPALPRFQTEHDRHPAAAATRELDIARGEINAIIWATGYRYDFGWIECAALDADGAPIHNRGVSPIPGLYFLGLPRLHKVKSAILWGVGDDAAHLAEHIASRK